MKIIIAERWSKETGLIINPEDIYCKGCRDKYDELCSYSKKCKIRICAEKRVQNSCAECKKYPCRMLKKFLKPIPEAKEYLDELNKTKE